ncbi:MAG: LytTR family DNA-binding domain-containing protein [Cyclobacteriaceae bacterium]|nr:LytTR family DNA-binding domain-containing protein [Cyclobacteriaceae bacterium]
MSIRCLVVDDEPLARKLLISYVETCHDLVLVGACATAMEARIKLREEKIDLVFLDIQMPQLTGMQLLQTLNIKPAIVFTTAYRDYAPEAFEVDAMDYLVKPISQERFLKAVDKFYERFRSDKTSLGNKAEEAIFIRADRVQHKVNRSTILYIESLDNYVKVVLREKTIITRETITSLEKRLSPPDFVRIHRSFIVNAKHIQTLSLESVRIADKELPLGRAFKQRALSILKGG